MPSSKNFQVLEHKKLKELSVFKLASSYNFASEMSVTTKNTDALFRSNFFSEAFHLARQYETREEAKERSKARRKCVRELWKLGEYWLFVLRSLLWFALFAVCFVFGVMCLDLTPNPLCDVRTNFKNRTEYTSIAFKGQTIWFPEFSFIIHYIAWFLNRILWFSYNVGLLAMELHMLLFTMILRITDPSFNRTARTVFFNATICDQVGSEIMFKDYHLSFLTQGPLNF